MVSPLVYLGTGDVVPRRSPIDDVAGRILATELLF